MKHIFTLLTASALGCASVLAQNFGGIQTGGDISQYRSEKDVNYAGDNFGYHKMDIYFPSDNAEKHPVLIHIYGSAWQSNDGKGGADLGSVGAAALANGYIFVTPNHRSLSDAQWPAQSHDIKACIRYMRGNAERLGVDTSFIAISGFSSGGHLASVMGTSRNGKVFTSGSASYDLEGSLGAYTDFSSSVDAVCDWSGPVDLLDMDCDQRYPGAVTPMKMPQIEESLIGCTKSACPDKFKLLSAPTFIDPSDPPFFIAHGSTDNVVPQCQGIEFASKLEAGGVYVELYKHGGGHGVAAEHTADMIKFLAKARAEKVANSGNGNGSGNNGNNNQGNNNQGNDNPCDEKQNFHVYLAFGQSNMWGNAQVVAADQVVNPRIKKMVTWDGNDLYNWVDGVPPYAQPGAGYSMADKFARTLADNTDDNVSIGVVCVAIPGTSIKAFDPDQYQSYLPTTEGWLQNTAKSYGNNPYKRLLDCAKKAQETGTIKGMIFHQGESDWGYGEWASVIAKIYNGLCSDLGLNTDEVGFVLGELLDGGGAERMQQVASLIKQSKIVDTDGLPGDDQFHFTHSSYETIGVRYAEAMMDLVSMDGCGGSATTKKNTPYKGVAAKIPGRIEAENYDEGGNRVGWYDASSGNSCDKETNTYRSDDVDIKKDGDDYIVGNCQKGEWMKYTVNVEADGDYTLTARVGEGNTDGKFSLKMDDGSVNYTVNVEKTGDWGTYSELVMKEKFTLTAGEHVLTLTIEQDWVDIDWIEFKSVKADVEAVSAKRVAIVPNPTNGLIEVVAEGEVESVSIYNMLGELVKTANGARADVSALGEGVFVVKAVVDGEEMMQRLVVRK